MDFASNEIEAAALRAEEFANEICQNESMCYLLEKEITDEKKLEASEALENQFQFATVGDDILAVFITGENGLELRHGKEAALSDINQVKKVYSQNPFSNGWGELQENPCKFSNYSSVILYYKAIWNDSHQRVVGHLVMFLRQDIFLNIGTDFLNQEEAAFSISKNDGGYIAGNENWEQIRSYMEADSFRQGESLNINDMGYIYLSREMPSFPWTLVTITPNRELAQQMDIVREAIIIAVLLALILSLILSSVFSDSISKPIRQISREVETISQGNFEVHIRKDSINELRRLEDSVEKMQTDLKNMLDDLIRQEEEKSEAEIQMLKAQINPHFLYNTLNSIKMMAVMQGSKGIQNMTEALGDILRESLSDANEENSLRDELKLLDKYIYIQNIRYKGNIEYSVIVENEDLYDFSIQKFLLQPIVENAISHGVEYESQGGMIQIRIWNEEKDVYISVEDDGEGIPEELLNKLNRHEQVTNRSIGVHNVDQRIHKIYGDGYGLTFESVLHKYTKVQLKLRMKDSHHE
ncbi:MAG: sensor histidine kinase [Lachnospiraceae bacterium]|nr:sensor histidine kinase [Lachnospiraceae bacterium]